MPFYASISSREAHDLALEQRLNYGDDISSQLRLAKKHHFTQQDEKRISQEIELQVSEGRKPFLNKFISSVSCLRRFT